MSKHSEIQDPPDNQVEVQNFDMGMESESKEAILKDFMRIRGVGAVQAEKIFNAQIYSVEYLATMALGELMERTGFVKKTAQTIQEEARKCCDLGKLVSASELIKTEGLMDKLSTGSEEFNKLLGGGYPTKLLTEIHAENGIGKTQAAFTASVMATRSIAEGGLDAHVAYIDTEGTFSAKRVAEIAKERGFDVDEVLTKIHVIRVSSAAQQMLCMDEINKLATQVKIRLLVVDSVIAKFRNEFVGRGKLAERQGLLNIHFAALSSFSNRNDAAVILTNQVSATPDAASFFGPQVEAVGGNIVGHNSAFRIYIRRAKAGNRVVKLEKAPSLPPGECIVALNEKGICDPKGK